MAKALRPWKTLSKRPVLDFNKFLRVESHTIKLPDGSIIDDWAWVISPDAVIVLACDENGYFLCFRQTKYAVDGTSLAPVGGMLGKDEDPLVAAKRELLEETGYEANKWVNLGSFVLEPNRGVETVHLFLALGAQKVSHPESDDLEDQELLLLSKEELKSALHKGEFKVLSWTAVVAMALNWLGY